MEHVKHAITKETNIIPVEQLLIDAKTNIEFDAQVIKESETHTETHNDIHRHKQGKTA